MYFPYLRGRQFELIAIRELIEQSLIGESIIPVIEPVKLSSTLIKTMSVFQKNDRCLGLVRNPCVGSIKKDLADEKNEKNKEKFYELLKIPNILTFFYVDENIAANCSSLESSGIKKSDVATICASQDSIRHFESFFTSDYPRFNFIPDESVFRRRLPRQKVLFKDRFPKKSRNVDYADLEDEPFSSDHTYYSQDGYVDFSDFSVIGDDYSETGFAPYAVAIHIVYFDAEKNLNESGIPSEFLIAESDNEVRDNVKRRLMNKEINVVFVVDIYNEGIDIPEVNTVLFLRPTESLTVFLQQLGRGLRLYDGKEALTVLDFVGQAHQKYSFEDRFKALLSRTRKTVEHEIKTGFANVPRGCSIQLEKQAQEYILDNIRNAINNKRNLISKLHDFLEIKGELNVREFCEVYHVNPQDVYSKKMTVSGLAAQAGLLGGYKVSQERERLISFALGRLSLANSRRWIRFIETILPQIQTGKGAVLQHLPPVERTMLAMFYLRYGVRGWMISEIDLLLSKRPYI